MNPPEEAHTTELLVEALRNLTEAVTQYTDFPNSPIAMNRLRAAMIEARATLARAETEKGS